jgi:hypothetical protein
MLSPDSAPKLMTMILSYGLLRWSMAVRGGFCEVAPRFPASKKRPSSTRANQANPVSEVSVVLVVLVVRFERVNIFLYHVVVKAGQPKVALLLCNKVQLRIDHVSQGVSCVLRLRRVTLFHRIRGCFAWRPRPPKGFRRFRRCVLQGGLFFQPSKGHAGGRFRGFRRF